jgi:hypothetical protein
MHEALHLWVLRMHFIIQITNQMLKIKTYKKSGRIVKLTEADPVPDGAKFLYAKEEFGGMYGWESNLKPFYKTVFYYELPTNQ